MSRPLPLFAEPIRFHRGFADWLATFASYDGTEDTPRRGRLIGSGSTRYEALLDLLEQEADS